MTARPVPLPVFEEPKTPMNLNGDLEPGPPPAPLKPARTAPRRPAPPAQRTPPEPVIASRRAVRQTAANAALHQLIEKHNAEYSELVEKEHERADTSSTARGRAGRLIRAGLLPEVAEAFAAKGWPDGLIAAGVRLTVENDEGSEP